MDSTASVPFPLPGMSTLNKTLGAILIGGVLSSILYGISCLQCFIFFQRSEKKQLWLLNASVWAIWCLDTVHLAIFVCYTLYWYMIRNFGNTAALGEIPWSLPAGILLTTISDGIVRLWFLYRVWLLSNKNKWLTFPMLFIQVSLIVIASTSAIRGFWLQTFDRFTEISGLLYSTIGLMIASDFTIAGSLCYFLRRSRQGTFSRKTRSLINILMVYTVNTGLLTSIISVVTLILYITLPDSYCFLGVYFLLEKLFANSLLASLNARDWVLDDSTPVTLPIGTIRGSDGRPALVKMRTESRSSNRSNDVEMAVRVQTGKAKAVI